MKTYKRFTLWLILAFYVAIGWLLMKPVNEESSRIYYPVKSLRFAVQRTTTGF